MEPTDKQICAALQPFGVPVDSALPGAIRRYIELLLLWNRKMNLTSVTDPREILARHFGESMFAAHAVPIRGGTLVDIGSGAGFPGLALKLCCPALTVKLIEPVVRKGVFLSEVARSLGLASVEVITKRTDQIAANSFRADYVTARAVGDFRVLLKWAHEALTNAGQAILWLGEGDSAAIEKFEGWSWKPRILIPQSTRRVLLIGSKSA